MCSHIPPPAFTSPLPHGATCFSLNCSLSSFNKKTVDFSQSLTLIFISSLILQISKNLFFFPVCPGTSPKGKLYLKLLYRAPGLQKFLTLRSMSTAGKPSLYHSIISSDLSNLSCIFCHVNHCFTKTTVLQSKISMRQRQAKSERENNPQMLVWLQEDKA